MHNRGINCFFLWWNSSCCKHNSIELFKQTQVKDVTYGKCTCKALQTGRLEGLEEGETELSLLLCSEVHHVDENFSEIT